ncbi:dihydroorotase [Oryzomicrobium sp.]|uniref:dihydroorotase n=1 Tax=Oryzomicrobium sp. TaxID=1911578 RepID=UPI002FE2B63A
MSQTTMKIAIKNGRVVDPRHGIDAPRDLFIADGKIAAVLPAGQTPDGFAADRTLDAAGQLVLPGVVDLAARLPGLEPELEAAVAGGVTRLACPPDSDPPMDEPELVERLVRRAQDAGLARVHPVGALTQGLAGEKLAEMAGLAAEGCVAFSQAKRAVRESQSLLRALQYAATFDFPVWCYPQNLSLARGGVAHDGEVAARLGLPGIPVVAETVAIAQIVELCRATGVRIHLTRLSSAAGVALVRTARAQGLPLSADVAVHHLHLTDEDIGFFNNLTRVDPPLRTAADRAALREGLADGTLAAVCSDHTPLADDERQVPFGEATPGVSAVELLLPLTLAWAREAGVPLATAVARLTCDPAALLGVAGGDLGAGAPADVVLFDPEATWTANADTLVSRGRNTPFLGRTVTGRTSATLVGGRLVYARQD